MREERLINYFNILKLQGEAKRSRAWKGYETSPGEEADGHGAPEVPAEAGAVGSPVGAT